ncbi:hypothetical protein DPMN_122015 [Dreissena polymorpha]|uniref:Uncharacterized protein n=1 Tax=Dreissena polymorpha TaxID=45954 RepID=A0A9D4GN78_DREPO|nr:hypothetical protein DPMN_122015 [Dreissena polymorpha]
MAHKCLQETTQFRLTRQCQLIDTVASSGMRRPPELPHIYTLDYIFCKHRANALSKPDQALMLCTSQGSNSLMSVLEIIV